ncbi:MAG: deoxyribodipyrimidine photolyase, partial [Mucilaginibacter sp.]|nr:deoxyribodipyrimidine photolyase [Mucilaginibacter sp.]
GELPTLQQLGLEEPVDDSRATYKFAGGETAALIRLHEYFLNSSQAHTTKGARSGSADHSSKLSPWLALGCISPRKLYWEVIKHDSENNTHHSGMLILELLWRDYFRFMFKKHGQKFYKSETDINAIEPDVPNDELFESWKNGHTGVPFIDASMHELNATGYINNYSRQMVAGYLVRELEISWIKGAAYFEEKLIDYSPASNRGNWAFIAGMSYDPKDNRYFNLTKPVNELEIKGEFVDTWLPEVNGSANANHPVSF